MQYTLDMLQKQLLIDMETDLINKRRESEAGECLDILQYSSLLSFPSTCQYDLLIL
jgi:hypothetical protein